MEEHKVPASPVTANSRSAASSNSLSSTGTAREYIEERPRVRDDTRPQSRRQARWADVVLCAKPRCAVRSTTRCSPRARCRRIVSRAGSARLRNRYTAAEGPESALALASLASGSATYAAFIVID